MVQDEESGEELDNGNRSTFDVKTFEESKWRLD